MKQFKSFLIILFLAIFIAPLLHVPATFALKGSDFNPGRIIDDGTFTNRNFMSAQGIQDFLNAKVPVCDTNGTQRSTHSNGSGGYYTRAQWGAMNGNSAPFTCLKDYIENPATKVNNYGNPSAQIAGGASAAQIIWNAAQESRINPAVLLVTLQKEQALIADDWPYAKQYRAAMGYGCPDTAECDTRYYGFSNQVKNAAAQFRRYLDNPGSYNYTKGTNFVRYNPDANCGGTTVNIQNMATAALYIYTPYQPNASSLANTTDDTPGPSGDNCGAYGNRNFWWYYNKWFGTTRDDPFNWDVVGTYIYDMNKNIEIPTDDMHPGERYKVTIKVQNMGTETWWRDGPNPIKLGTFAPYNNSSRICDSTWLSCTRPAKLKEESLGPGQVGHFEFIAAALNDPGEFRQYFQPVLEDRVWMTNDTGYNLYSRTTNRYNWQWMSYDAYSDSARTTPADVNNLARNQTIYITMRIRNTSASTWSNTGPYAVRIATAALKQTYGTNSPLCTPEWLTCSSPSLMQESLTVPGGIATFKFPVKASANLGEYREYFKPVVENKGWGLDNTNHMYLRTSR